MNASRLRVHATRLLAAACAATAVPATAALAAPYDPATDIGSMYETTQIVGAPTYWKAGFTGRGVDIALIDTGVAPVAGLTTPGKVVNGPDLSFESQATNLRYVDTFGHGTHLAGIIAGRDATQTTTSFTGMAPDATWLNGMGGVVAPSSQPGSTTLTSPPTRKLSVPSV